MKGLGTDLRGGLRGLLQNKLVSGLAIVSLALAIAGNTAVFSMISAMFLRPLPFDEPEQLVFLNDPTPSNSFGIHVDSQPNFLDVRERSTHFDELVAYTTSSLGLETDREPESVTVMAASEGFLDLVRWKPLLGRPFSAEEEAAGGPLAAILSHAYWSARFGGEESLVGETLDLSGRRYEVIGVLPPDVEFLTPALQVFVPLQLDPAADVRRDRGGLSVIGRLAAGSTFDQANQEVAAIGANLEQEHPDDNQGYRLSVISMRDRLVAPPNRALMAVLQAGLFFVLLIACANVANLLLAQGQKRTKELALRAALGAERGRIVTQLLIESIALALIAFGIGLGLGLAAIRGLSSSLSGQLPKSFQPALDPNVIAFTVGVAVLSGLLFGLLPALRASRTNLAGILGEGGRGGTGAKRWLTKALVVSQLALAMSLLAGSSIMVRSLEWLQFSSPGFEAAGLHTVTLQPPTNRYPGRDELRSFYEQSLEQVRAVPGVENAALVSSLPRSPFNPSVPYRLADEPEDPERDLRETLRILSSPGYFETLGVTVLRGRDFDTTDRADSPPVAVINQAFALRNFQDSEPIGERVVVDDEEREVVGVVADVWQELLAGEGGGRSPVVYVPTTQVPGRALNLVVRTPTDDTALSGSVRSAIWQVDPRLSVGTMITFEQYVGQFFGTQGLGPMLTLFGGLSLLLAAIGIYGVVAFSVGRRTREIGLRMALGADRGRILRLFGMEGLRLLAVGLAIGIPAVILVTQAVGAALSDLVPIDPTDGVPMLGVLIVVAVLATYIPARRAAKLEPVKSLRVE